ncbi:MAG: glycosyltransferase family 4 protein, partial [Acidimicrobiales bacterium]
MTSRLSVAVVAEQLRREVPGGIGTYARGLLAGLARVKATAMIRVVASRAPGGGPDPLLSLGFPLEVVGLPGPLLSRAWGQGLWRLRSRGERDVVHSVSSLVPAVRGGPVSLTIHDLGWRALPEMYPPRGRRWHEAALERAIERAAAVVVPSEATARDLIAAGMPESGVVVIAEGSDHLAPPDHDGAGRLLASLGVSDGFLLSVGTREPRKNLRRLLSAYSKARPDLAEPWPLVVVGPQGWGAPADAARLPEGAVVAGEVSDGVLASLYGRARLVVYVPLFEGFGLPALEAMAAGTPVVASTA